MAGAVLIKAFNFRCLIEHFNICLLFISILLSQIHAAALYANSLADSSAVSGIGVDDMFLMMSSWSESLPSNAGEQTVEQVPKILGKTLASACIGMTITSLTDFFAFVIGTTSVFTSVTNFSLYAGE